MLKRDHHGSFEQYLRSVYDPRSDDFHHFLSQREIANHFVPSQREYEEVRAFLITHGLSLVEGLSNRMTLTVRGSRASVENAFGVNIGDYRIGKRTFYAN